MQSTNKIVQTLQTHVPVNGSDSEQALAYARECENTEVLLQKYRNREIDNITFLTEKFRTYRLINSAEENAMRAGVNPQSIIDEEKFEGIERISIQAISSGRKKLILTLGCQGTGDDLQRQVAARMDKVIKRLTEQGYEVSCVLVLGDNVYSDGAKTPDDHKLRKCCENMYTPFPYVAATPFFYIQGNHDQNRHRGNILGLAASGIDLGLQQVAHNFMPDMKYRTVAEKIALYNQKIANEYVLNRDKLSHFNMPGRAYSLIVDDIEVLCIDSNTYVKDYLDYKAGKPGTQAEWLELKRAQALKEGRKTILALHHPPNSLGNRVYGNDKGLYLSKPDVARARAQLGNLLGATEKSYNAFVRAVLKQQNLEFDTILAAHDHSIYYVNDGKSPQIVSAGGGGKLQDRYYFDENQNVANFLDNYGFVILESDREKINYAFYTLDHITEEYPLMYNNKSTRPVRYNPDDLEQQRIEKYCLASMEARNRLSRPKPGEFQHIYNLCTAVKTGIEEFMKFMAAKQRKFGGSFFSSNFTHDHDEIKRAHRLLAYISSPHIACLDSTLINVVKIGGVTAERSENSLSNYLLNAYHNIDRRNLFQDYTASLEHSGRAPSERTCSIM